MAGTQGDAPPTYEQALQHRRIDPHNVLTTPQLAPPDYTTIHNQDLQQYRLAQYHIEQYQHNHHQLHRGQRPHTGYDTFAYVPPTHPHQGRPNAQSSRAGGSRRGRSFRRHSEPMVILDDDASSISSLDSGDTCIKMTLVPMNMCMAVTCLVINIILPGFGTMLSGACVFCCVRGAQWTFRRKVVACAMNVGIGLAQLLLVPVVLLGWVWSILWGFAFLGVADDHSHKDDDDEDGDMSPNPQIVRSMPGAQVEDPHLSPQPSTSGASVLVHSSNQPEGQASVRRPPNVSMSPAREPESISSVSSSMSNIQQGEAGGEVASSSQQREANVGQQSESERDQQSHRGEGEEQPQGTERNQRSIAPTSVNQQSQETENYVERESERGASVISSVPNIDETNAGQGKHGGEDDDDGHTNGAFEADERDTVHESETRNITSMEERSPNKSDGQRNVGDDDVDSANNGANVEIASGEQTKQPNEDTNKTDRPNEDKNKPNTNKGTAVRRVSVSKNEQGTSTSAAGVSESRSNGSRHNSDTSTIEEYNIALHVGIGEVQPVDEIACGESRFVEEKPKTTIHERLNLDREKPVGDIPGTRKRVTIERGPKPTSSNKAKAILSRAKRKKRTADKPADKNHRKNRLAHDRGGGGGAAADGPSASELAEEIEDNEDGHNEEDDELGQVQSTPRTTDLAIKLQRPSSSGSKYSRRESVGFGAPTADHMASIDM